MRKELHPPPPGIAPEVGTLGEMLQAELGPPGAAQPADTRCHLSSSLHPLELNPHTLPPYTHSTPTRQSSLLPSFLSQETSFTPHPAAHSGPKGSPCQRDSSSKGQAGRPTAPLGAALRPQGPRRAGGCGTGRPCRQEAPGRSGGHSAARRRRLCPAAHPRAGARRGRAEAVR